jgi:hypothetical protein
MSDSQCLMTGVYRSGTEFTSLLLSGHPDVSSTMYHVNVLRFCLGRYDPIDAPERLSAAVGDIAERLLDRYSIKLDADAVIDRCRAAPRVDYAVLYDSVMSTLWIDGTRRHWVEKAQLLWREIPRFIDMMPNGRAILVVRDPRSVLASFKRYTYAPPPAYLGAIFNCYDALQSALRYRRELPQERFLLVRYEEAALEPEAVRRQMFEFLGVDPERGALEPSRWRDASGAPWVANSSFDDGSGGFDASSSVDRWKRGLEAAEIGLVESVCGDLLPAFGYEPSGVEFDWLDSLRLFLHDGAITEHFRRFLFRGEGVEAFPTDPLEPQNWEENN